MIRTVKTINTWVARFQCDINILAPTRECIKPKLNIPVAFHTLIVANPDRPSVESIIHMVAVRCTTKGNSNLDAIGNVKSVVGSVAGLGCATFGRSAYIKSGSVDRNP